MAGKRSCILYVSKPLDPPWSDSGKTLVRDIALHVRSFPVHVMASRREAWRGRGVTVERVYRASGDYSPGIRQNLRVFLRLLRPDPSVGVYHFFFAPNPMSSAMGRLVMRLKRGKRSVHTVCSSPREYGNLERLLFADVNVVLSDYNLSLFREAGIRNVTKIRPAIDLSRLPPVGEGGGGARTPTVLFAGDYEFSHAAWTLLEAVPAVVRVVPEARFVFACRLKTQKAKELEDRARARASALGVEGALTFLNEVEDMASLIRASALGVMPADSLYAKMDIPLVLLESVAMGVPLVVSDLPPLRELASFGCGEVVPARDSGALAKAVSGLLADGERRAAMAERGRRAVRDHFAAEKVAGEYERLYGELLSDAGKARKKKS